MVYTAGDVQCLGITNGMSIKTVTDLLIDKVKSLCNECKTVSAITYDSTQVTAEMPKALMYSSNNCAREFLTKYIIYDVEATIDSGFLIGYISDFSYMPSGYTLTKSSHVFRGSGTNTIIVESDKLIEGFHVGGDKLPLWFEASYFIDTPCGQINLTTESLITSSKLGRSYAHLAINNIGILNNNNVYTQKDVNDSAAYMVTALQNKIENSNINDVISTVSMLSAKVSALVTSAGTPATIGGVAITDLFTDISTQFSDIETRILAIQETLSRR